MSSAEQKASLIKDYNKRLQNSGLTDPLKVPVSERTNNICDWSLIKLSHLFDCIFKNKRFSERLYWMPQRRESLFLL